jgi:ribosomal protein L40E
METVAKERKLKNRWVCMSCNYTMRNTKKMEFCKKCGSKRVRAKKKGKNVK